MKLLVESGRPGCEVELRHVHRRVNICEGWTEQPLGKTSTGALT
jgi:hypothetical protein